MAILNVQDFSEDRCPIKLHHIHVGAPYIERNFAGGFGNFARARAAYVVIWMLQTRDEGFAGFTLEEFRQFCELMDEACPEDERGLQHLIDERYIVPAADGKLYVSFTFVVQCFGASPAKEIQDLQDPIRPVMIG